MNPWTGVVIAVQKNDRGRIVGVKLAMVPVTMTGEVDVNSWKEFLKSGFNVTSLFSLETLYFASTPLFNAHITQHTCKNGKTSYSIVGTRGNLNRYPVIDKNNNAVFSRSVTILAKASREETQVYTKWVGNRSHEESRKVIANYFFVANYDGRIGFMSEQQVINLHLKYCISNAQLRYQTIIPINTSKANAKFLEVPFPTEQMNLPNYRAFSSQLLSFSDSDADREYFINEHSRRTGETKLTRELLVKSQRLADLLLHPEVQGTISDADNRRIQSLYQKILIWGSLPAKDLEWLMGMYDNVNKSITGTELRKKFHLEEDENYSSAAFQDMLGTINEPIDVLYNTKVYSNFTGAVKSKYCAVLKSEPLVSGTLEQALKSCDGGAGFGSFKFRIKSPASLAEKVYERAKLEGKTTSTALAELTDALRYTVILECNDKVDNYCSGTKHVVDSTKAHPLFDLCKFANYWGDPDNPYRGINTAFKYSSNSIAFEVQFHTQESFDLKNGEMHRLYEEKRAAGTTAEKRKVLTQRMFELSDKLRVPNGVIDFDMMKEG